MEKIKSIPIQKYADGKLSNLGVNAQRVNPCPQCGHNDCCTIYKDSNSWYCYSCGSGGSVIDYVMAEQKMSDVSEAIKIIARDNGIILDKKFQENINKESKIQEIFNLATWYYNQILNKNNERLEYLTNQRKRTITQINKHNYGLSNGKLNQLLHKKGYTSEQILSSGLVRKKDNKFYDFFAPGFLVYPVYLYGKVSDFYAKKGKDSYQLPKDYKLRNVRFYGEEALSRDSFILVEGQEDRNTILQISDQYNVACILGNLTPDQINILAKKIVTNNKHEKKTVYCCFDNDHQGRKYLDKIADMFSHLCYLKVIEFPEEYKDIDEYLRQLYLYSIPVYNEYKIYPKYLIFNVFRCGEWIEEPFQIEKFEEAKQWVIDTINKIKNESAWLPLSDEYFCNHLCGMRKICEYKPRY